MRDLTFDAERSEAGNGADGLLTGIELQVMLASRTHGGAVQNGGLAMRADARLARRTVGCTTGKQVSSSRSMSCSIGFFRPAEFCTATHA